jgi:hypothetical protein
MDEDFLNDLKRLLEDGVDHTDWKCVEDAIELIREACGEFDDEFEEYES